MNFQKLKESGNLIVLFLLLMQNYFCKSTDRSRKVIEIITAVAVDSNRNDYTYSQESITSLNGKLYSMRSKAIYGLNGDITKLVLYKPEGVLEYNATEVMKDTNILHNLDLPVNQTWSYYHGSLKNSNGEVRTVDRITEDTVKAKKNEEVAIYKLR